MDSEVGVFLFSHPESRRAMSSRPKSNSTFPARETNRRRRSAVDWVMFIYH